MKSLEEAILVALMDGEDDEAERLVNKMLPSERDSLRAVAIKLEHLAAGRAPLPGKDNS